MPEIKSPKENWALFFANAPLFEPWEQPTRKRRERKLNIANATKQFAKAGLTISGAIIAADGSVTFNFGDNQSVHANDLDLWMNKNAR